MTFDNIIESDTTLKVYKLVRLSYMGSNTNLDTVLLSKYSLPRIFEIIWS